jgi:hypothetical protein
VTTVPDAFQPESILADKLIIQPGDIQIRYLVFPLQEVPGRLKEGFITLQGAGRGLFAHQLFQLVIMVLKYLQDHAPPFLGTPELFSEAFDGDRLIIVHQVLPYYLNENYNLNYILAENNSKLPEKLSSTDIKFSLEDYFEYPL